MKDFKVMSRKLYMSSHLMFKFELCRYLSQPNDFFILIYSYEASAYKVVSITIDSDVYYDAKRGDFDVDSSAYAAAKQVVDNEVETIKKNSLNALFN